MFEARTQVALGYAASLAQRLRSGRRKLRVFLDVDEFQAGDVLTEATKLQKVPSS